MLRTNISPNDPAEEHPTIGLIGMGAMGAMYAKHLSKAGWKKICVCDLPDKLDSLKLQYADVPGITVYPDGHAVSRISDFIMYSVEAEYIDRVVAQYGPSTKVGAIVSGQTSVKAPEKDAFEKYLPPDVHIVSLHSLHGPTVSPEGQPLVLIQHRAPDSSLHVVESIFRCFGSRFVYLTYEDHDLVTANVQAVTHAAFLTMGTAWASQRAYPWEQGQYVGGIETVKVNIMLRIYANKWHIDQYASSASALFKLMLAGDEEGLRTRIYKAARTKRAPIFLTEDVLDQFTIGGNPKLNGSPTGTICSPHRTPTSHSLRWSDCWAHLQIQPFDHLDLAATPIFRMWIGVAEYLFRSTKRLDSAIRSAVYDVTHRSDDLEFVIAARGWSQCVSFGSLELYKRRRFEEASAIGSEMIKAISQS
ncbi:hypothetical protein EDB19DRAFT_1780103 [Suillus lakei]|nr:hypothetical protein EDB19DRAFT_1780103 [Suillus lakei]